MVALQSQGLLEFSFVCLFMQASPGPPFLLSLGHAVRHSASGPRHTPSAAWEGLRSELRSILSALLCAYWL
ncbi:hypothetical protein CSUI_006186 [Cystoisospora suis]|uniref:Uncharacterized protein n=1 Tax=Cystoisospora suis TaxID=483139 RepID=A0A2C6KUY7_9APIC|nr:hypothetical protein CSUI_006186 [Cystoisospora suis]